MRKVWILLSSLVVMVFIAGCGNTVKTEPAKMPEQQKAQNMLGKEQGNPNNKANDGKQTDGKAVSSTQQQAAKGRENPDAQTPDSKLRRELMSISRLDRSDSPITKEQAVKLIPIIEDIKVKETIDSTYADKQVKEIENILTSKQKELLSQRPDPDNMRRERNGNNTNPSTPQNPPQAQNPDWRNGRGGEGSGAGSGMGSVPGAGPRTGNGRGFDLKTQCDRLIESLKSI